MRLNTTSLAVACFALVAAAHSDTTITSTTSVQATSSSISGLPLAGTYTTYYSGNFARTTRPDGSAWIFDFSAGQVTTLTAQKTYYTQSLTAFLAGTTTAANVTPRLSAETNSITNTVAGLNTAEYKWSIYSGVYSSTAAKTGVIPPSMRRTMFSRSGQPNSASSAASSTFISGTFEMTNVASGLSAIQFAVPQLAINLAGNPGLAGMAALVQQTSLVPLATYGRIAQSTGSPNVNTVASFSSEVTQVTAGTVDSSLFTIPTGYTKTAAPTLVR